MRWNNFKKRILENNVQELESIDLGLLTNVEKNLHKWMFQSSIKSIPEAGPMGRLVKALLNNESDIPLSNFDRKLLLLSFLIRGLSHHPGRTRLLLREICLEETDLQDMLLTANKFAPELLYWAFAWAELFFVHALC